MSYSSFRGPADNISPRATQHVFYADYVLEVNRTNSADWPAATSASSGEVSDGLIVSMTCFGQLMVPSLFSPGESNADNKRVDRTAYGSNWP
jgi:hypothetical protein